MPAYELYGQEEIDAVVDVLQRKIVHRYSSREARGGIYRAKEFEEAAARAVGAKYCQAVSSGSAALYVALKALGVGPGDEVITSAFTFIASIEAILECGAVPVLADIDESLNLDPESAEDAISEKTKVIMPVHMYGAAADMERFRELCDLYGLYLLEDACQALGATYKGKGCGTLGDCGTYSLDPNKVISVGEGGLIVTDDEGLYRRMEYYHDHGHIHDESIDRGAEGKACLGFNFRISEIQGALGLAQLKKLPRAIESLRSNKKKILEAVGDLDFATLRDLPDRDGEIATQLVLLLPDEGSARAFQKASKEAGAGCSVLADNTWHYAKHWKTLREGTTFSRLRCPFDCVYAEDLPSYRPIDWVQTDDILSRAVMYGINIVMGDEDVERMAKAVKAGLRAAS